MATSKTGAYIRAERNGKWQPIGIDELTNEELQAFCEDKTAAQLTRWVIFLASWIRDEVVMKQIDSAETTLA